MRIHLDSLDRLFARYIRLRDKVCQRCFRTDSLQTAHFYGRRNKMLRHDPENACLLCFGCHQHFHENPLEFFEWWRNRLGEEGFVSLQCRSREIKPDREAIKLWLQGEIEKLEREEGIKS